MTLLPLLLALASWAGLGQTRSGMSIPAISGTGTSSLVGISGKAMNNGSQDGIMGGI